MTCAIGINDKTAVRPIPVMAQDFGGMRGGRCIVPLRWTIPRVLKSKPAWQMTLSINGWNACSGGDNCLWLSRCF
jgi:hypothetical protein